MGQVFFRFGRWARMAASGCVAFKWSSRGFSASYGYVWGTACSSSIYPPVASLRQSEQS
jgi:hypothetical protein